MELAFKKVETADDQERLAQMAAEIWNEYWPPLIGQDQVDYMVENFQSLDAIRRDMAQHAYEYWFIYARDDEGDAAADAGDARTASESAADAGAAGMRCVGYTGGHPEPETDRYFISKIYLLKAERGRGIARRVIAFYDDHARDLGFRATYLTVNKYNAPAVRSYEKNGFRTIDSVETDIGSGFIMDDYIMERPVS